MLIWGLRYEHALLEELGSASSIISQESKRQASSLDACSSEQNSMYETVCIPWGRRQVALIIGGKE